MAVIKIKNKKGTSEKTPPTGYCSWLDFWEKKKGKNADKCEAWMCSGKPDVGGHVIKSGQGNTEYILPLCYACNNKPEGEEFEAWDSDLVPVK